MQRVFLVFCFLALSVEFMTFNTNKLMSFPFSDQTIYADTWAFFLFEHIGTIILAMVILDLEPRYRYTMLTFVLIQCVDTVDYLLTYSEPWGEKVPSFNILKLCIFGIVMTIEICKNLWKQYRQRSQPGS